MTSHFRTEAERIREERETSLRSPVPYPPQAIPVGRLADWEPAQVAPTLFLAGAASRRVMAFGKTFPDGSRRALVVSWLFLPIRFEHVVVREIGIGHYEFLARKRARS